MWCLLSISTLSVFIRSAFVLHHTPVCPSSSTTEPHTFAASLHRNVAICFISTCDLDLSAFSLPPHELELRSFVPVLSLLPFSLSLSLSPLSLSLSDSLDPSDHFRVALLCSPSLRSVVNSVHYPAYTGNGIYTMANGVAPPTMESLYRSAPYRMSAGQKLTFDLLSKTPPA
jgi:hypothetical protein